MMAAGVDDDIDSIIKENQGKLAEISDSGSQHYQINRNQKQNLNYMNKTSGV